MPMLFTWLPLLPESRLLPPSMDRLFDSAAVAVDRLAGDAEAGGQIQLIVVRHDGARDQRRQLQVVAAVERDLAHLRAVDGAGNLAGGRIDLLAGHRDDVDGLRDPADLELEVGGQAAVGVQLEAGLLRLPESGELCGDAIAPDRQVGDDPGATLVGNRAPHEAGAVVGHGDRHARQHRARRVQDCAGNLADNGLRQGRRRQGKSGEAHADERAPHDGTRPELH